MAYTGEPLLIASYRSGKIGNRLLGDTMWVTGGAACTRQYR